MPRPRRTLVFLAVTGEEKGMQGSEYWARHPSVSGRAVANVNLDMFLMLHPCEDLVVFGAEHSSLGPAATRAAEREGLAVSPDPDPEQVIFIRSDQFAFIREGVPAVFPVAGRRGDAGTARARWMRTAYHSPQDDLEQAFDWGAGVEFARFVVRLVREVAEADAPPAWNPGDFFGEAFGGERPSADADRVSSGTR
jgi:Zn-dependent M28 family amino/carboxypeptidase